MKKIIIFLFVLFPLLCFSQDTENKANVVLTGGLFDCDTVDIYVIHDTKIIAYKRETVMYSLTIGVEDYYLIKFIRKDGAVKTLHFFCYNIKDPTVIPQSVHFNNKVNLILWTWRFKNRRGRGISDYETERTFYGEEASWKLEF